MLHCCEMLQMHNHMNKRHEINAKQLKRQGPFPCYREWPLPQISSLIYISTYICVNVFAYYAKLRLFSQIGNGSYHGSDTCYT